MIKDCSWLTEDNIISQLKEVDCDTRHFQSIIHFVFSPFIVFLMGLLDKRFDSELGAPAYPRLQLLIILLFAEEYEIEDLNDIPEFGCVNDIFKIITPIGFPCKNTISKFLECDYGEEYMKKWGYKYEDDEKEYLEYIFLSVFIYTLVRFNDYDFYPKDKNNYLDSTDAIVRNSINNIISEDKIEALKLMKQWDLLHDLSDKQINKTKNRVKLKQKYYKNNEKMTEIINLILKRIKLYNIHVYKKIDAFEEALEDSDKEYVPVNFPEAVKIKSKRGKWVIGFLLQELVTSNSIILTGALQRKSNDQGALEEIEEAILANMARFKKIQKEFGERNNPKEIENLFLKSKVWCDSGYDGEENIKTILISEINFIVLPKKLARQINKKLQNKNPNVKNNTKNKKDKNKKNDDDYTIDDCERIENGYQCPNGNIIELIKTKLRKTKRNKENKDLPEPLKEQIFYHECQNCEGCPYFEKYGEPCSIANYKEYSTQYHYDLTNSFVNGEYEEGYKKRFAASEGINGYLKRNRGILKLHGNNLQTATNHMHLKNTLYNIIRFVSLKGTVC